MRLPHFTLLPSITKPHTHTHYPGIGQAENCQVDAPHEPKPWRYVWHHICPQVCGGKTEPANLVSLCDNCHYGIHCMLVTLQKTGDLPAGLNPDRELLARQGYEQAKKNGKVHMIPHEGHAIR